MRITVVAFKDDKKNSIAYKNFETTGEAVAFYKKMLEKDDVNTISTRKVKELKGEEEIKKKKEGGKNV